MEKKIFKFKYIDVATGNLSVTKNVVTSCEDTNFANEPFEFTVNLFDSNINGTYGDMTFDKGISKFTLKHNEVKTASSLPADITYEVIEDSVDGYTTSSENSTVIISSVSIFVTTVGNVTVAIAESSPA